MGALEIAGRGGEDLLAGRTSPVSDTMRTRGCDDQGCADALAAAADDVDDPLGKSSASDFRQLQRGQRRLLGGLENDRVAGGERGRRASMRPSSTDSSRARSRRRRRPDRAGSCWCSPADIRRPGRRAGARAAPAKKRNTSAIAGISSFSAAAAACPCCRDSSLAYAAPSAFDAIGEPQQQRRAVLGRGLRPRRRRSLGRGDRRIDLGRGSPPGLRRCIGRSPDPICARPPFTGDQAPRRSRAWSACWFPLAHRRALFLLHIVEGQGVRRRGTLDVLAANLAARVPCTATGTSRRAMAIDLPVRVETMAQVTTPTFLSPE